jgi:hypothetical protein
MIPKLDKAKNRVTFFLVILVIILFYSKDSIYKAEEGFVNAMLENDITAMPGGYYIIKIGLLLILGALFAFAELLAHYSVENLRSVRKLALRKEDIEGAWLDVTFQSKSVAGCAYIFVLYDRGRYSLEGEVFDRNGLIKGHMTNRCPSITIENLNTNISIAV